MRKRTIVAVAIGLCVLWGMGVVGCSGGSNEVVVNQKDQEDPQTRAMREQMVQMMRKSRERAPQPPAATPGAPGPAPQAGKPAGQ